VTNADEQVARTRVVTVPNLLSMTRIVLTAVFAYLLLGMHEPVAAAILLGALGATDWFDGFVARHFHQVSLVGKVLDPTADRILLGTAVVGGVVYGAIPEWLGAIALLREVIVSLSVLVLAGLKARRVDVLWVGKAGTFGMMFALPAFLLSDGYAVWQQDLHQIAWIVVIPALALSWVALGAYLPKARKALSARSVDHEPVVHVAGSVPLADMTPEGREGDLR